MSREYSGSLRPAGRAGAPAFHILSGTGTDPGEQAPDSPPRARHFICISLLRRAPGAGEKSLGRGPAEQVERGDPFHATTGTGGPSPERWEPFSPWALPP